WGRVLGADKKPMSGVSVSVGGLSKTTDSGGYYSFDPMTQGSYPLAFYYGNYQLTSTDNNNGSLFLEAGADNRHDFTVSNTSVAAEYIMDDISGSAVADLTGNSNNATLSNMTSV
ncbi:MAG: carboxypeptidase-like regulatory domain-containing protein, partial [Chloroflexi bacterium]|nr:carboxypeptidase-like regulatory domain-containing protein [Chloroflexota bacterium]